MEGIANAGNSRTSTPGDIWGHFPSTQSHFLLRKELLLPLLNSLVSCSQLAPQCGPIFPDSSLTLLQQSLGLKLFWHSTSYHYWETENAKKQKLETLLESWFVLGLWFFIPKGVVWPTWSFTAQSPSSIPTNTFLTESLSPQNIITKRNRY